MQIDDCDVLFTEIELGPAAPDEDDTTRNVIMLLKNVPIDPVPHSLRLIHETVFRGMKTIF